MKTTTVGLVAVLLLTGACGNDEENNGANTSGITCFDAQTALEDAVRELPVGCVDDADCELYEETLFCGCLALSTENQDVSAVASASDDLEAACEPDCAEATCAHGTEAAPKDAYCDAGTCRTR